MAKYPNRTALYEAHNIYRDAMREFMPRCLRKVPGTTYEKIITRILNPESNDGLETVIDIGDFPRLIRDRECWIGAFSQMFGSRGDMDIRGMTSVIADGRKFWAHPRSEDVDSESTRTHLSLVAEVLGGINKPDAKREVEDIRNRLFSDESEEHPLEAENAAYKEQLADITKQLEAAKAEKTDLEKQVKTKSDRLAEVEAEWIACEERLETTSDQLKDVARENAAYQKRIETAEAEKAKYEKVLKTASNQLATLKRTNAQLEKRLETTSPWLEEVEAELADYEVEIEERTKKEADPIPPTEFPYTGSQLRDFRKKAGLTQAAVAVDLGMKRSSSSAISDWEVEREKVPPKHYTKLKELYGLEVSPGNDADEDSVQTDLDAEVPSYPENTVNLQNPIGNGGDPGL